MQGVYGMTMKTSCNTKQVLDKIRENRERHARVLEEARRGYVEQATAVLRERLKRLEAGEAVSLKFDFAPPVSHLGEYDTVIEMLKMHVEETIVLNADEVRQLVQDQWHWMDDFVASTARYTGGAK